MNIHNVRHDWPEKAGFSVNVPAFQAKSRHECCFTHMFSSVRIRLGDEVIETLPGGCIFFAPDTPRHMVFPQDTVQNWMNLDASFCEVLEQYGIPMNTVLYPGDTAFISEIFRKLELEYFSDNPYKEALMDGYVQEFVVKFARAMLDNAPAMTVRREDELKMRDLRIDVLSQPEKRWTVAEMAALVSLSPSRFHAVYKTIFATSPMQDLIDARVHYAKSLLLSNERLTLSAIAEKLGYNDQYHFIRQFKAVTGQTPGAFRKTKG